MSNKNYTEALQNFDRALEQNPNHTDAWIRRAEALQNLNQYDESLASYDKALRADPSKAGAIWSTKAKSYAGRKDYLNASASMMRALGADNGSKEYWYLEGLYLQMQGSFAESLSYLEKALAIDPHYTDAIYRKGIALTAAGKTDDALGLYDEVLAPTPANNKRAYFAKAMALESLGRYSEALEAYNKSLELDPGYAAAVNGKMHVLMLLKKNNDAMAYFTNM